MQGELVGLITFKIGGGENLNFAVPTNYLRAMVSSKPTMTMTEFAAQYPRLLKDKRISDQIPTRVAAPIRGEAEIGYLKPLTTVDRRTGIVRTTIRVKNLSTSGSITGLKVEEFWYDSAGAPVTGSRAHLTSALKPGEVAVLTCETPLDPKMYKNSYTFSHANGTIRTQLMAPF